MPPSVKTKPAAETKQDPATPGSVYAPYLAQLTAQCGHSTGYQATPAVGSKLEMTSGTNWGVTKDAQEEPGPDIYSQLGDDWRQYMGGMTANCSEHDNDVYYTRHNIATFYSDAEGPDGTLDRGVEVLDPVAEVVQPAHACSRRWPDDIRLVEVMFSG